MSCGGMDVARSNALVVMIAHLLFMPSYTQLTLLLSGITHHRCVSSLFKTGSRRCFACSDQCRRLCCCRFAWKHVAECAEKGAMRERKSSKCGTCPLRFALAKWDMARDLHLLFHIPGTSTSASMRTKCRGSTNRMCRVSWRSKSGASAVRNGVNPWSAHLNEQQSGFVLDSAVPLLPPPQSETVGAECLRDVSMHKEPHRYLLRMENESPDCQATWLTFQVPQLAFLAQSVRKSRHAYANMATVQIPIKWSASICTWSLTSRCPGAHCTQHAQASAAASARFASSLERTGSILECAC